MSVQVSPDGNSAISTVRLHLYAVHVLAPKALLLGALAEFPTPVMSTVTFFWQTYDPMQV
jgi:hypothetical protein